MGHKLLTKLHLKAGADGSNASNCPGCGREGTVEGLDGDTLQTLHAIPARVVAGRLALASGGHCFSAMFIQCVCAECKAPSYSIQLDVVDNPEVSEEWASKYFHLMGEEITEPSAPFIVTAPLRAAGIPKSWLLERTQTADGVLDRHYFGPFLADGNTDAAAMLGRLWPLITRPEPKPALRAGLRRKHHYFLP